LDFSVNTSEGSSEQIINSTGKLTTKIVFHNNVLRCIFGHKRQEVLRRHRTLHSEERHNPYTLTKVVSVNTSRKTRWSGM